MSNIPHNSERNPANPHQDLMAALHDALPANRAAAIATLGQAQSSSLPILAALEKIALSDPDDHLRQLAAEALNWPLNRAVRQANSKLDLPTRTALLDEINLWEQNGLIRSYHAGVLKRRYDFDIIAPTLPPQPIPTVVEEVPPEISTPPLAEPFPASPESSTIKSIESKPSSPPKAPLSRSISQTLLSEVSIRIALFLGAFLVISAALTLAALVEATRLPLLLTTTVLFGAAAVTLRKRLPLPSFVLFIVFSCLIPISAGVIADNLGLVAHANTRYWIGVLILLTGIWSASTWFYRSRFFSLCALGAWLGAFALLPQLLANIESEYLLTIGAAVLLAYPALFWLKRWQGSRFSLLPFLALLLVQAGLTLAILLSLFTLADSPTAEIASNPGNLCFAAIFLAASFVLSQQFTPLFLFPWLAVLSLVLVPYLAVSWLRLDTHLQMGLEWASGAIYLFAGEAIYTWAARSKAWQVFRLPLQIGGILLLFTASIWAMSMTTALWLITSAATAAILLLVQLRRPRWWVWSAALLAALSTYFAAVWQYIVIPFHLQNNPKGFQTFEIFTAAMLLLLPDLFFAPPWSAQKAWRWPLRVLGWLVAPVSLLSMLGEFGKQSGLGAFILWGYALFTLLYALRWKRPWLGYACSLLFAVGLFNFLDYLHLNHWPIWYTGLAALYFGAGLLLRRSSSAWSQVLRFSGLALGLAVACMLPFYASGQYPERGWLTILIAILFFIETCLPARSWFELAVYPLAFSAAALRLYDGHQPLMTYLGFACTLVVFTLDQAFKRLPGAQHWPRMLPTGRLGILILGALLTLVSTFLIVFTENNQLVIATLFGIYALFFLTLAFLENAPRIGYAAAAYLPLCLYFILQHGHNTNQLIPLTLLGLIYYLGGLGLDLLNVRAAGWPVVLRRSGLALSALVGCMGLWNPGWQAPAAALCATLIFTYEMSAYSATAYEAGMHFFALLAFGLAQHELRVNYSEYFLAGSGFILASLELVVRRDLKLERPWRHMPAALGLASATLATLSIFINPSITVSEGVLILAVLAVAALAYALIDRRPWVGLAFTAGVPLAFLATLRSIPEPRWLFACIAIACVYYAVGTLLKLRSLAPTWALLFSLSGLALASLTALSAPFENSGLSASIPVAIAATLFAIEAWRRHNVWLGFPTNALYLMAYFMILFTLKVDQVQYYSSGAALLGLIMHYLLVRAGSRTAAFITGVVSQLVLLGTSYIQMVSTVQLSFFFVLFAQALVVLFYAILIRSRSLVITSILFTVLGVVTVVFYMLKGISTVVLLGCTGIVLLTLGILAVMARERLVQVGGKISESMQGWLP